MCQCRARVCVCVCADIWVFLRVNQEARKSSFLFPLRPPASASVVIFAASMTDSVDTEAKKKIISSSAQRK